jgi:hypothetical protein
MRLIVWRLMWARPGHRLLIAAMTSSAVRRSLLSARGRRRTIWLMLEDAGVRGAAFDVLEHHKIRAAVIAALEHCAPRTTRPAWIRRVARALHSADRRTDLRQAFSHPSIRRDLEAAAVQHGNLRAMAIARILGLAAGLKLKDILQ